MKSIAIVATEPSGDLLGADLIVALRKCDSSLSFFGIGGPNMIALGFESIVEMERLSVMGFIEPLKRLPEILSIRKKLIQRCLNSADRPGVYIGIDGPDFNLTIEKKLKNQGIKTIHYISPTVWAWRPKRIFKIKKATDHNFLIFPFEKKIYDQYQIPATYVGHPLANEISVNINKKDYQNKIKAIVDIDFDITPVFGLLPGSRESELKFHLPIVLETATEISKQIPKAQFLMPCANAQRMSQAKQFYLNNKKFKDLKLNFILNHTTEVLAATSANMVCSGTATLQALLCKTPFLIFYKTSPITYFIAKKLVKTKYIGMANIVAETLIASEYIQENAEPLKIANDILKFLDQETSNRFVQQCHIVHQKMLMNAKDSAARVVMALQR